MLLGNIINDSFGLLSKQLRFYCWHFRRDLDQRQRQELIQLLYEQHFERLANKIKSLNQNTLADCRQQIGKLLFDHCLTRNRRHQLVQLIESGLVDINVRLDNYGRTLLHRSAYNLDVELVKILIDNGVNIRLRDYAGNTALHIAIQSYRNGASIFGNEADVVQNLTSIIRYLLDADKSLQDKRSSCKRIKLMPTKNLNITELSSSSRNLLTPRSPSVNKPNFSTDKTGSILEPSQDHQRSNLTISDQLKPQSSTHATTLTKKQETFQLGYPHRSINPILLEDFSTTLVDTRNAFGRTALHYCVLVVGEQHLADFVYLLISYGADTDALDTRFKTPLYCLVKRPGVSAIRQKCLAIGNLLDTGCDDLGLAIQPKAYFTEDFIQKMESKIADILQSKPEGHSESIISQTTFERVPSLKHLARLHIIRKDAEEKKQKQQTRISLPATCPAQLNTFINRKILNQKELF